MLLRSIYEFSHCAFHVIIPTKLLWLQYFPLFGRLGALGDADTFRRSLLLNELAHSKRLERLLEGFIESFHPSSILNSNYILKLSLAPHLFHNNMAMHQ